MATQTVKQWSIGGFAVRAFAAGLAILGALAKIAAAHEVQVAKVVPAMIAALKDEKGAVKEAAIDGLSALAGKIGPMEESVMKELGEAAGEKNPAVARKAAASKNRELCAHIVV